MPPMSRSMNRSAGAMSLAITLSRLAGLVREQVIAGCFAPGATDAFWAAFRIPNMLRRFFAEGAFTQGFVPVFAEYKTRYGEVAARELASRAATLLALLVALITALGMLAAPILVYSVAWKFSAEPAKFDLTVYLLRWVFPYIFCISLVSLAGGILNSFGRFKGPAFTPVLLNLSFIGFIVWVAPRNSTSSSS